MYVFCFNQFSVRPRFYDSMRTHTFICTCPQCHVCRCARIMQIHIPMIAEVKMLQRKTCFMCTIIFYAHVGIQSVQMELWTTTLQSHFNIDRYQVCAHDSHSQKCDPTRRKSCRTRSLSSKNHSVHFSEHIFCSTHQLTCLHHVRRLTSTL